jgi:hypothetical protein
MNRYPVFAAAAILCSTACAESPAPTPASPIPTNAPAPQKSISIQEMLVIGHSGMKLHSLAMITQGKVQDGVDESFLPGFKTCSEDSAIPVRSIAARLLGQYFVEGQENPNPEAVALLIKLAGDESSDVRYNAVYHGLSRIQNKSPEIVEQLIKVAAGNREQGLYERIVQSLKENQAEAIRVMDALLAEDGHVAIYEIYEDLAGKPPVNADHYLDLPSSRPRLFIFKGEGADAEAFRLELEKTLKAVGLQDPGLQVSGSGENYVILLKTYLTKDYKTVEKEFSDHEEFKITQDMWLTPELEIQIEAMRKAMK